jgi:hypothetical protein
MLHFFAGVLTFFGSLFGPVQPAPTPLVPIAPPPVVTHVTTPPSTTTSTTTIVNKTVYQYLPATSSPAITVSPSGVTQAELTGQLAALQSTIEAEITNSKTSIYSYSDTATGQYLPRTGGTVSGNLTVNGVTGLTSGDIPDLSARYLSTAGGTISGNLTITGSFNGAALSLANASTTLLSVLGPAYFGATATSTFGTDGSLTLAKALAVGSGGTGTTTWQTGSIPFFNGTRLTEKYRRHHRGWLGHDQRRRRGQYHGGGYRLYHRGPHR